MDTNWDNLRYFHALASCGTLSAAARKLGVSHSTVQRHVAAFEGALNVKLFNHASSGYKLTGSGETLYRETATIQQTLKGISSKISAADNRVSGEVSITASDTIGHVLLPELIAKLKLHYPKLQVSLNVINQLSNIRDLEADIAIRSAPVPPADLIGRQVGSVRFSLCAASTYLQQNNLQQHDAVVKAKQQIRLDKSFSDSHYHQWLPQSADITATLVNGFYSAYLLCRAGLGVALLPAYLLRYDAILVELQGPQVPKDNPLWILSHADLRDSAKVKTVRQFLAQHLSEVFASRQD